MRRLGIAVVFLCLCAATVWADQVTLKNGDRLTGTIVKTDDKAQTLLIKTEFAGDVTVKWEAVTSLETAQPLHLTLKDGRTIVGTVTTTEGALDVTTKTEGEVKAAKENVAIIRSDAEQTAHDAEVYRKEHPKFADFWSGLFDTGLNLTGGNSSTINYTLTAKTARVTEKNKISMYATAVYGKNNAVSPTETTAHEIRGGVRGEANFSERFFAFGFTDFGYNELQHLDLQNVVGAGAGYHAVKNARTTFDLSLGGSYNQEYFSAYTLTTPTPTSFPSLTQKNAEIVIGEALNSKLTSRTTVGETFSIFPDLSKTGNYRYAFASNISTKLKNWLGWQVTFNDNYISNPPTGLKGNDLLFSTGLRLTFGKGVF
jgi:small nuclear ribonucleoprotein (snRNP)-like protein